MGIKMEIVCLSTPSFCPRKEDWLNDCPRQLRISKNSKNLFDLKEACAQCRMLSVDAKTNPQNHPIGYGDLFQCENGEVLKA